MGQAAQGETDDEERDHHPQHGTDSRENEEAREGHANDPGAKVERNGWQHGQTAKHKEHHLIVMRTLEVMLRLLHLLPTHAEVFSILHDERLAAHVGEYVERDRAYGRADTHRERHEEKKFGREGEREEPF